MNFVYCVHMELLNVNQYFVNHSHRFSEFMAIAACILTLIDLIEFLVLRMSCNMCEV